MKLKDLLYTVGYGTEIRLVWSKIADDVDEYHISTFTMKEALKYKKEYESIEPYLENKVIVIAITPDGKLYIEIL